MKKHVLPFKWREELVNLDVNSIGSDIVLIDKPVVTAAFDYPFKIDVTTAVICLKGRTRGRINLKPYETTAPCLIVILPDQILEYEHISDDFEALFIVMSSRFTESLNIEERFPAFLSIQKNPYVPLNEAELEALTDYYRMIRRTIASRENPHCLEIARLLTKAFFYGFGYNIHVRQQDEEQKKPRQQMLAEKFLGLVQANYHVERNLGFYANELCLTPKYLSKIVRENSGISASDWIDSYVITDAKALLKSTDMTVQQISDRLNFPSQSFFGKYFKRVTGISPRDYKKGISPTVDS